ncbi:hypothetical protein OH77DRAFT_1262903 [Trametes cingulata]|nr:hypothetical protein OH77DRAFT_1262903 [Trametes cingulata]
MPRCELSAGRRREPLSCPRALARCMRTSCTARSCHSSPHPSCKNRITLSEQFLRYRMSQRQVSLTCARIGVPLHVRPFASAMLCASVSPCILIDDTGGYRSRPRTAVQGAAARREPSLDSHPRTAPPFAHLQTRGVAHRLRLPVVGHRRKWTDERRPAARSAKMDPDASRLPA